MAFGRSLPLRRDTANSDKAKTGGQIERSYDPTADTP